MGNTVKNNGYLISYSHKQQGVVLAVALIMLVLITLLAVSSMRATTMEERMASNSRNDNIAFQLAETALRKAEEDLSADPDSVSIAAAQTQSVGFGTCEVALNSQDFSKQTTWNSVPACDYIGFADNDINNVNINRSPQYFIEFQHAEAAVMVGVATPRECFYRITARGYGPDENSAVTLQTTYRFDACI